MSGMSDSKVDKEPSIEEILSSIRQIINEDDEDTNVEAAVEAKTEPAPKVDAKVAKPAAEDEALDLSAFAEDEPEVKKSADVKPKEPVVEKAKESETPMSDEVEDNADDFAFEDTKDEKPAEKAPTTSSAVEDTIMSDDSVNAAAASLTKLAEANIKIDHNHAKGDGSITLEDVVKQMLKPMMKEWLDGNLPPLVERLVEKEIRKISNR